MGSKSLDKTETYLTVLWEEFQVCLSPLMLTHEEFGNPIVPAR